LYRATVRLEKIENDGMPSQGLEGERPVSPGDEGQTKQGRRRRRRGRRRRTERYDHPDDDGERHDDQARRSLGLRPIFHDLMSSLSL